MKLTAIGYPNAERAVLGVAMQHGRAIPKILAALETDAFVDPRSRAIRDAIESLHAEGKTIDPLTLHARLDSRGHAKLVGGFDSLRALARTQLEGGLDGHIQLVHDAHRVRLVQSAAAELARRGAAPAVLEEPESYIADATRVADGARRQITRAAMPASIGAAKSMSEAIGRGKATREPACPLGLPGLDELLVGGLRRKRLYVIGAGSGVGKTSLMLTAIRNSARDGDHPHLAFSLEMEATEMFGRLIYGEAGVSSRAWERGLDAVDLAACARASDLIGSLPIWIDDTTTHWPAIEARGEAWLYEETDVDDPDAPVPVIWVDYLQLASAKAETREREIASMSRGAKLLVKRTGCAVVLLAQLNDDYRKSNRPPRKSDLRECKAVAHDADGVMLLDADEADAKSHKPRYTIDAIVDKQRQGPVGKVPLTWVPAQTRFEDGAAW